MGCVDCQFYIRISAIIFMPLAALGVTIVLWVLYQEARDRFIVFTYSRKTKIQQRKTRALRAKRNRVLLEQEIQRLKRGHENGKQNES